MTVSLFLYLSNVFCASGQTAFGKLYAKRGGTSAVFNFNKALAGTLLFLVIGLARGFCFHLPTAMLGAIYGVALCISMHAGFIALAIGPMALTSIFGSFSLVIPFLFGIIFWSEPITLVKAFGLVFLLLAILLINGKREAGFSVKWFCFALLALLCNGVCSVVQKMHQIKHPGFYQTEFMFWALLSVLFIMIVISAAKREGVKAFKPSFLGLLCGILNCLANYIVLYLSATENASVLFPIVSIANIIAVWAIGVMFFKERTRPLQTAGLVLGIISVVLLKI